MQRIVGGDQEQGFITKGDANENTEQERSRYPLIQPEWIAGVVPTLGQMPLKIPLLGYISVLLEQHMDNLFC
jgi:signal peptidase